MGETFDRHRVSALSASSPSAWPLPGAQAQLDFLRNIQAVLEDGQFVATYKFALLPGVAYQLRRFHPLVTGLARARWMSLIRGIPANHNMVGQAHDLERFLFGNERQPITHHLPMLTDQQRGLCLYCGTRLRAGDAHVDHFIPWSLHRFDALPNLVAAHGPCNLAKRDMLAAERHLERWVERNAAAFREPPPGAAELAATAGDAALRIARWAYQRNDDNGAAVWLQGRQTERLSGRYRRMLEV